MSNKRKIVPILGLCGATVLSSGGSIYLTNTGMSLLSSSRQVEVESEAGTAGTAETAQTEQLQTIEQFASTSDSFVVSSKKGKEDTK